jgi:hypothetical protein
VVEVIKLLEPNINAPCPVPLGSLEVTTILFAYDGDASPTDRADCRALFVDPTGDGSTTAEAEGSGSKGDLYLVTANTANGFLQRIFKIPVTVHELLNVGSSNVPEAFTAIPVAGPGGLLWEGADISKDGSMIMMRTKDYMYFYPRLLPTQSVAQAIASGPCPYTPSARFFGGGESGSNTESAFIDGSNSMIEVVGTQVTVVDLKQPVCPSGWEELFTDGFELVTESESKWDFVNVAEPAQIAHQPARAHNGVRALVFQQGGNSNEAAKNEAVLKQDIALSDYDQVKIDFFYLPQSIESRPWENFELDVSSDGGVSWINGIQEYRLLQQYPASNAGYYNATVILDQWAVPLTDQFRIRFRFSSQFWDFFYVADVTISGIICVPDTTGDEGDADEDEDDVFRNLCPLARQAKDPASFTIPASLQDISAEISYMAHSTQLLENGEGGAVKDNVWYGSDPTVKRRALPRSTWTRVL